MDVDSQVIVAAEVVNEAVDRKQAIPMMKKVKENIGENPRKMSADAGYYSEKNIKELEKENIDVYITPGRLKHTEQQEIPVRGRPPLNMSTKEKMKRKLQTKKGKLQYGFRKETVEPVFGQIKHCRGFRQFSLRGLKKVKGEWSLICITHNILKLYRNGFNLAQA